MKELFNKLPRLSGQHIDFLVDTCFLFFIFQHGLVSDFKNFCSSHSVAITSFNAEEFMFHSHDVSSDIRVHFRSFVKSKPKLFYVHSPVSPGDRIGEKNYVSSFDKELLKLIPDPSDAVLVVDAVKLHANILTRDKHHLFTSVLNNYLTEKNISVFNNLVD